MTVVADTTPYPWPFDAELDAEHTALVVTGWDAHWHGTSIGVDSALTRIRELVPAVGTTVLVGHRDPRRRTRSGPPVSPLDPGLALHRDGVATATDPHTVSAEGVDGFFGSPLDVMLRRLGIDRLLFAGFGLETTVHSTLRSANDRGYECLVVLDACSSLDPTLDERSVSMIEMSGGIFGAVGTTDAVVAALTTHDHPRSEERP